MTTAHQTRRTPHAVQAGFIPATLWLTATILSIASTVGSLFFAWSIGTDIANRHFSLTTLTWAIIGGSMIATGAQVLLRRAIRIRVPGGLRSYTRDELIHMPTVVPSVISGIAHAVATMIVGAWALEHRAEGDSGFTVATIAFMVGFMLLLRVSDALSAVFDNNGLTLETVALVSPEYLASAFLVVKALDLDRSAATTGLFFAVVLAVMLIMWKVLTMWKVVGTRVALRDLLDDLSDAALHQVDPAPTLARREKARILGRSLALAVAIVLVLLGVAMNQAFR